MKLIKTNISSRANLIDSYLTDYFGLTDKTLIDEIKSISHVKTFKKKSYILRNGEEIGDIPFLISGIVKIITFTEEDQEYISEIYCGPCGPVAIVDFHLFRSMTASIDAVSLTETQILLINASKLRDVVDRYLEMQRTVSDVYIRTLKQVLDHNRLLNQYNHDLFGFYQYYADYYPSVIANSTLEELSSFFGVSIYQLSRVRSRYKKENCQKFNEILALKE